MKQTPNGSKKPIFTARQWFRPAMIARTPQLFSSLPPIARFGVLSLATLLIASKGYQFYQTALAPKISQILALRQSCSNYEDKIYTLIYFDILVCLALFLCLLFFVSLLAGEPNRPRKWWGKLRGHFFVTFVSTFLTLTALVVIVPTLLINLYMPFSGQTSIFNNISTIHPTYMKEALLTALCFALHFADINARAGVFRWWAFIVLLWAPMNYLPLLWWNALAGLFPSRYWRVWRPVLTFASVGLLLLVFPNAQQIRKGQPLYRGAEQRELSDCLGYQIERVPGKPELFMRCSDTEDSILVTIDAIREHPGMHHYRRLADGGWQKIDSFPPTEDFWWDEGAIDWQRSRFYLFSGTLGVLHIFQLDPLKHLDAYALPYHVFPKQDYIVFHALDEQRGILVLANREGWLVSIDLEEMRIRQAKFVSQGWKLFQIAYSPEKKELFVLQNYALSAFNVEDLSLIRTTSFTSSAYSFYLDAAEDRIIVGFPQRLAAQVLDWDTFTLKQTIDAPAGLRSFEKDAQRNLFFFSTVTGVVEMRRGDNFGLLRRVRLRPWIHDMKALPEFGELVATYGDVKSSIWRYDPPAARWNLFGALLHTTEKAMRFLFQNVAALKPEDEHITPLADKDVLGAGSTIVMYSRREIPANKAEKIILPGESFDLLLTANQEEFKSLVRDRQRRIDQIIIAAPLEEAVLLSEWTRKLRRRTKVLVREQ